MYLQIHSQTLIHADNSTLRFPYKCILICLQTTFSCIHLNTDFLRCITKLILSHQMHSHKLKSTFSYGLHKHTLTYEQAYTYEQLHTRSWKCAYTCIPSNLLTHSLTKKLLYAPSHILVHFHRYNIITKSIILICLQMNMLTLTMKFTHLHTHTDALVYLHAHTCTLTHRSILHFHVLSHAFTHTHMNILTFMPMVTNSLIHKKSPIHFPPANSFE